MSNKSSKSTIGLKESFKVMGRVKFVLYQDEEMKVNIQIYSMKEECWMDLYYDKKKTKKLENLSYKIFSLPND